jgi:tetratricopeptide (TPR) repeat protein
LPRPPARVVPALPIPEPPRLAPDDACSRARAAADAGDYAAAEETLLETIRTHPTAGQAYHLLGSVHAARGALDQAIEELRRATFLDPQLAAAHLALGQVLARAGRTAEARRHLRSAVRAISAQLDHELVPELGVTAKSARRIAGDALRQLGEPA